MITYKDSEVEWTLVEIRKKCRSGEWPVTGQRMHRKKIMYFYRTVEVKGVKYAVIALHSLNGLDYARRKILDVNTPDAYFRYGTLKVYMDDFEGDGLDD